MDKMEEMIQNDCTVSVVMSTYREDIRLLRQAVESVLGQTYREFEFLIGVDAPDNQALIAVLREYENSDARIRVVVNRQNLGLAATLNGLIASARGTYIARMDADDVSMPRRLEVQLQAMEQRGLDICSCDVAVIDEQDRLIQKMTNLPSTDRAIRRKLKYNNCVPHPGWMVGRHVYEALGGYERTPYCEDYEFLLKARKGAYVFGNVNRILLHYRMTTDSISRSNLFRQYLAMQYCQRRYVRGEAGLTLEAYMDAHYDKAEEEKYNRCAGWFSEGLRELRGGHVVRGGKHLLGAFFGSGYYRDKMFKYLWQVL